MIFSAHLQQLFSTAPTREGENGENNAVRRTIPIIGGGGGVIFSRSPGLSGQQWVKSQSIFPAQISFPADIERARYEGVHFSLLSSPQVSRILIARIKQTVVISRAAFLLSSSFYWMEGN